MNLSAGGTRVSTFSGHATYGRNQAARPDERRWRWAGLLVAYAKDENKLSMRSGGDAQVGEEVTHPGAEIFVVMIEGHRVGGFGAGGSDWRLAASNGRIIFSRRTSRAVSDRSPSATGSYRRDFPILRTIPLALSFLMS
jgi:hypothetical protein